MANGQMLFLGLVCAYMHACTYVCAYMYRCTCMYVFVIYKMVLLLTAVKTNYEQAHRSCHGTELQNLDYCMKKQTDDITNTVNK